MTTEKAMTKEEMEKFLKCQFETGMELIDKMEKKGDLPPALNMLVDDAPVEAILALILATYETFKRASEEMGVEFSAEELIGREVIMYAFSRMNKVNTNRNEGEKEGYKPAETGPLPGYM